ncbi:MAG: TolC family protein [Sphingobacteriaceae bacterium]
MIRLDNLPSTIILAGCISCFSAGSYAQVPSRKLGYFIQQAQTNNPILADYRNQAKSLAYDSALVYAKKKPQVNGMVTGYYAPRIKGYGFDEVITNGQALEGLLQVDYSLLNGNRSRNTLERVKLSADSIKYASGFAHLDLERNITEQYLLAYASQQDVDFNQQLVDLLANEDTLLRKLTRSNIYKQSEYLTFLVTYQQQKLTLQQAVLSHKNYFATLNYLAGIADTTTSILERPVIYLQKLVETSTFFNKKFEVDSLIGQNQKSLIALRYKPLLSIYANGGYNSSLMFQPYKNFGTSVGLNFSIPIYDGHQRKLAYNKIDLSLRTIANYKDFFTRQRDQQLNLISVQLASTEQLFPQIEQQLKFAKGLMEVDARLMHTGDVRISDFVIAINNYLSVQNLLVQTTLNRFKLINQFNYWGK